MAFGKVLQGESEFDEDRWFNDELWECVPDDFLWGCMLRFSDALKRYAGERINDPVLARLLTMGTFDWQGPDSRPQSTTQAVRFTTAVAGRLLHRLRKAEEKVVAF